MKTPPCSVEQLHEFIDVDFDEGRLFWKVRDQKHFKNYCSFRGWNSRYSGKEIKRIGTTGYGETSIFDKPVRLHVVIWAMKCGEWPSGEIDHINGVRADNRIKNLRCVSRIENLRNLPINSKNTSGIMGVSFIKSTGRWRAYINLGDGKQKWIGSFATKEDAAIARRDAQNTYGFHPNHGRTRVDAIKSERAAA